MSDLSVLELPSEMLCEISRHLNLSSSLCWRLSCHPIRRLVRPAAIITDWFKVFSYFPYLDEKIFPVWSTSNGQGTRMFLKNLYQATSDEHFGLLDLYRPYFTDRTHCTIEEEITVLHSLKYIAAMRGSEPVWAYMNSIRLSLGDDYYKKKQYTFIAAGHGQLDFLRDNLGVWAVQMPSRIIHFPLFDKEQKTNVRFRCPDPLQVMAENGLFHLLDWVSADFRAKIQKSVAGLCVAEYVKRHNTICVAYGHFSGIFQYANSNEIGRHCIQFILSHAPTTVGLDWLLANGYFAAWTGIEMSELVAFSTKYASLFLDWFADHDLIGSRYTNTDLCSLGQPFRDWVEDRMNRIIKTGM